MLVYPETRTQDIRAALVERHEELEGEYTVAVAEMALAGEVASGDDVADLGTKAFNREQEAALAISIRSRLEQVERALERLDAGHYGTCETCRQEIPVARLAAFPSVTLCVGCKSRSESRH